MPHSAAESQKQHLSKIRPHGLVNASTFTHDYARLLAFIRVYLRAGGVVAARLREFGGVTG
jgi:hypothetical protein